MARPRYVHHTSTVQWSPIELDANMVLALSGVNPDTEPMIALEEIAGRFYAFLQAPDDGASVADVRNHLPKVLKQLGVMRQLLEFDPAAKALMVELRLLRGFLEDNPTEMPSVLRIDPEAVLDDLQALETYIDYLQKGHTLDQTRGLGAEVFGQSQVTAWDNMVFELSEWCRKYGVPGEFHARVYDAPAPPFRQLISLIESAAGWKKLHRATDSEIRAIERAIAVGLARQQLSPKNRK